MTKINYHKQHQRDALLQASRREDNPLTCATREGIQDQARLYMLTARPDASPDEIEAYALLVLARAEQPTSRTQAEAREPHGRIVARRRKRLKALKRAKGRK